MQIAALLGDTFSLDYILAIVDIRPSKLLYLFDRLIKMDIIRKKAHAANGTYFFCTKKLPEMVFESMDEKKKRTSLSLQIDYLEKDARKDDESVQLLANLFLKFKENKERFQYIKKAADLLISVHKTEEALVLYKEIIDNLLEKARDPLETVILIDSVISYAPIAINMKPPSDILHIINETIELADKLENKRARVMLELCLGSLYVIVQHPLTPALSPHGARGIKAQKQYLLPPGGGGLRWGGELLRLYQKQGKYLEASPHYNKGWNLAQSIKDDQLIKEAAKLYALSLFWQGRIKEAIRIYEENLGNVEEIAPDLKDLWAYLMLAWSYGISGRIGRGLGLVETIRERAITKGYLKTQAFAHGVIALILMEARMHKEAEPHIKAALEIGEKINSDLALWIVKPCQAYVEFIRGNLEEARELIESAMVHQTKLEAEAFTPWGFEIELAILKKWKTVGSYSLASLIQRTINHPNIFVRGATLRYYALTKGMSESNFEEVEQLLRKSQELLQQAGANIELGRTQIELSRLYIAKKDKKQAKEFASQAYRTFSEIDNSLFPSQMNFLIDEKPKEVRWDNGVSELESAIHLLPDLDKYLGKVVTVLTDMFGAERAAILLTKEEGTNEDLHVAASRNFSPEDLGVFSKGSLRSIISNTLLNRKPSIISGHKNRHLLQLTREGIHLRSLALIPLVSSGKVIGLIYMDNRLLKEIFSKQDIVIITAIATQLSLAFKATILFKQLESMESSFQKENSFAAPMEEIGGGFSQIIGKSKVIHDVLYQAKKVAQSNATVLSMGKPG